MGSGDAILDKNIDVPILFFFKINSIDFVDNQQKIELSEIAAAVKEYNLKVKSLVQQIAAQAVKSITES